MIGGQLAAAEPQTTPGGRREFVAQYAAPLRAFLRTETGGAGLLLAATLAALAWANAPFGGSYADVWATELTIRLGDLELSEDLRHWVNDGLMVLFFFVIGLELRRQLSMGELTDRTRLSVPFVGAIAGLAIPALIYLGFNPSGEEARGWGIAMATDTAFVLGALALVGPACPTQLRVFLLSVAVVDDVGALAAIAVFYSEDVSLVALGAAGVATIAIVVLSRMPIWRGPAYLVAALALWLALLESGVHPTLGGVVAGLLISAYPPRPEDVAQAGRLARAFGQSPLPELARTAKLSVERAISPNERLQQLLHPWTSLVVVPIFALANAGVRVDGELVDAAVSSPVTRGVVVGLVVGKLVGVGLVSTLAVKLGLGRLPGRLRAGQLWGGAALAGIGFTISLFVADLAFDSEELRDQARVGVLVASLVAGLLGWALFRLGERLRRAEPLEAPRELVGPVDPLVDHIRGPADAPLTLLEYADFECPFCSRATGVADELLERFDGELRYVFRHLPIPEVHPHAFLAAEAAEAAGTQGAFWEMHDRLFAHQDALDPVDLVDHAAELGLDVERFSRELGLGTHAERVRADVATAEDNRAEGTPAFFVNGRRHTGRHDADALAGALDADRDGPPRAGRRDEERRPWSRPDAAMPAIGRRRGADAVGAQAPLELDDLVETPDRDGVFPRLSDAQIALLAEYGDRVPLRAGMPVIEGEGEGGGPGEGDGSGAGGGLVVVLSGLVAMVDGLGHDNDVRVVHGPGRFLGELGVLGGQEMLLTPVAQGEGEALVVPLDRLRPALERDPQLGDLILRAFLLRRSLLLGLAAEGRDRPRP